MFDGHASNYLGQLGIGRYNEVETTGGIDPSTGFVYTLAPRRAQHEGARPPEPGGLLVSDGRSQKVDQGVRLTAFAGEAFASNTMPIHIDPAMDGRPARVFIRPGAQAPPSTRWAPHWLVFQDDGLEFKATESSGSLATLRTHDVPELPGATDIVYTGTARGYGFRSILVRGIGGAVNEGAVDQTFWLETTQESLRNAGVDATTPCTAFDRELVLGLSGSLVPSNPPVLDDLGTATADATSAWADDATKDLLARPGMQCQRAVDVGAELSKLGVRDRPDELAPTVQWDQQFATATCSAPDRTTDKQGDEILRGFAAEVSCGAASVNGWSQAALRGPEEADAASVAEASSVFRVERLPDGGVVARITSVARGVELIGDQGVARIDAVKAQAESWATGRSQPVGLLDDPNCDRRRSAGSCFEVTFSGVTVTGPTGETFTCEQCETEENQERMVAAMQAALGRGFTVTVRRPSAEQAAGADDGFEAAIQKPDTEKFADQTLKNDDLPTVPALEVVRVGDGRRGRQRQIYQFAGVETSVTYGIICLLEIIDGECAQESASLSIHLSDPEGLPLDGGVFNVNTDLEGDGAIGIEESLLPPRTCTTTAGACEFSSIPAGSYVVTQVAAPAGYVPTEDPVPVTVPSGGVGRVDVVNGKLALTGIAVNLSDTDGDPLPGGVLEIHADDGDHARSAGDVRVATCTTDAQGRCVFVPEASAPEVVDAIVPPDELGHGSTTLLTVPPGAYVIHQASAPTGYQPTDDVGFDLGEGQIARANLVNGPMGEAGDEGAAAPSETPTQPPPAAGVEPEAPSEQAPPVVFEEALPPTQPVVTVQQAPGPAAPVVAPSSQGPTTLVQIIQSPGDAARLLLRQPKEAAAFGGLTLVFGAAVAGAWRRRLVLWLLAA
ncbi:MAG: hypothetical protein KY469_15930 [Actinobacteria bacterium]|nr:hypothetical protein [Actinomycetota bacterium]